MPGLPETGKSVVNVLLLNTRAMRVTAMSDLRCDRRSGKEVLAERVRDFFLP